MSPPELTCAAALQGLFCGEGEGTGAHPGVGGAAFPKAPPESFLDGVSSCRMLLEFLVTFQGTQGTSSWRVHLFLQQPEREALVNEIKSRCFEHWNVKFIRILKIKHKPSKMRAR